MLLSVFTVSLSVDICDASSNTIYVDGSNIAGPWDGTQEHPYQHIQDAIAAASNGDTVYVYCGNYNENLVINKILTFTGENKDSTTINGATTGNVVKINADNVNISGFTIQNPVGNQMKCIMMNETQNCKIANNIIKNSYDGIYLIGSSGNNISTNIIEDNDNYGILSYFSSNNIFYNNVINFNEYGISVETNSNNNQIFNNDIRGKQGSYPQGTGVNLGTSTSGNIVYHNYFNDFAKNQNAEDLGTGNTWFKSSVHEGNYWDDYTGKDQYHGPNQDIPGSDGIGDTPYNIPGGSNQDIYPLVNQPPVATIDSISPNPATEGRAVSFSGSGIDNDGTIAGYSWREGTTILSTLQSFSKSDFSVGTHTIYFKVKDDDGAWSSEVPATLIVNSQSGQTNQPPTATIDSISPNPATEGRAVSFSGSGIDNDGTIAGYSWREGTTILSTLQSFSKSDFSVGTHTIYFKVKDDDGAWSSEVPATLIVNQGSSHSNGSPTADAGGPYSGYVNVTISFNGSGSTSDGTVTSYEWNFGDGTTGIGIYPTHKYTEAKNYTVTLTVTNNGAKTDTDTTYANVSIKPSNQNGSSGKNKTPGFELITAITPIVLILLWRKRKL